MSALVQSILGGNASASWTAAANVNIPVTGSFGSTTTSGNLLLLFAFYQQGRLTGSGLPPTAFNTPVTSGITWSSILNSSVTQSDGSGAVTKHLGTLFICGNAASISAGTVTTVTLGISSNGGTSTGGAIAEFSMYEFSGIAHSSSTAVGGALIDKDAALQNQAGGNPGTANLVTTVSDLVIGAFVGNSANAAAGAGYTLGQTGVAATTAQFQYQTGVAPASVSTAFSGAQANWAALSAAFKELPASSRNRAYFFG